IENPGSAVLRQRPLLRRPAEPPEQRLAACGLALRASRRRPRVGTLEVLSRLYVRCAGGFSATSQILRISDFQAHSTTPDGPPSRSPISPHLGPRAFPPGALPSF